ncbi:hypothetical protein GF351_06175, partial [Candidatus Woesearchaeota archaeon]|nr:hypothetical protein [Candidatus Woesearchaeota archaeon]
MRKLLLAALLLAVLAAPVYPQDHVNSRGMVLNIRISGEIDIIPSGDDYSMHQVTTELSYYPKDTPEQDVEYLSISPEPVKKDDIIIFRWLNPEQQQLDFSINADVTTRHQLYPVKEKIPYPYAVQEEHSRYLLSSEFIDMHDPAVEQKAAEIAAGEDNLYMLSYKVASWIRGNVEYSLDTLTADATQKASWTIKNRYGVCDEITNLFVAMMRSLGVPTKYVSGVAYTNIEGLDDWGGHAWAEVYHPGVGWVPYDIAYGQLGWVDNTHIKLRESVSPEQSSTRYEWTGRNADIETKSLSTDVDVVNDLGSLPRLLEISAEPVETDIRPGSYNIIKVTAKNLRDHYVPTEIALSYPKELHVIGHDFKDILLFPGQKKEYFFIMRVEDDLQEGMVYNFPIGVYTSRNISAITSFQGSKEGSVISEETARQIAEGQIEDYERHPPLDINLECRPEKKMIQMGEDALISCLISNTDNSPAEDIRLCYSENCRELDLAAGSERTINFMTESLVPGKNILIISAENPKFSMIEVTEIT